MLTERSTAHHGASSMPGSGNISPLTHTPPLSNEPKKVTFNLMTERPGQTRPALPLIVNVFPHDDTASIITTVRNFFGLDTPVGVSFEDQQHNTLIARWENFSDQSVVGVRANYPPAELMDLDGPLHTAPLGFSRSRSAKMSNSQDGYNTGDDASALPYSRTTDHTHTTEISVENIVEGGRRKRPMFDTSNLPLFPPLSMPTTTSTSSVSPARRIEQHRPSISAVSGGQNPFRPSQALESPGLIYTNGFGQENAYQTPGHDSRLARRSYEYTPATTATLGAMLTPEATVETTLSEQDAAVSLINMSNMASGRTSGSAEELGARPKTTPSTGATSDEDVEAPPHRKQKLDHSGDAEIFQTNSSHFAVAQPSVEGSGADVGSMAAPRTKGKSRAAGGAKPRKTKTTRPKKTKTTKAKGKKEAVGAGPMSPTSLASRGPSVAPGSPAAAGDEEEKDTSSLPRCQRCRKSKKGCDRARPCGRCADAGITAENCISEDESNGRKGRYGRHMGVPLPKNDDPMPHPLLPAAPIATASDAAVAMMSLGDKNKKRKR
ncbi:hypothetical protein QBC39DRAFT_330652 [Podospora conica]|nr:hypothetical protein QBC39DRAFT_330652 [Schizothecium conicum]